LDPSSRRRTHASHRRKRASPPVAAFVYLAVIIVSWAGNWPLMKIALGQIAPLPFVLLRLVGSVAVIAPVLIAVRGEMLPRRGERLTLFWVGQLQVAGFLICSAIGLSIVPAGRAIVLAYTMPLWAIPIGLLLWPEPRGPRQFVGAAIGFAGLVLFLNPTLVDWADSRALTGNALLLLSAISWAFGSCLYRRHEFLSPFWAQTLWQLAVSVAPVALFLLLIGTAPLQWSWGLAAIIAYNCVVTTALGYFLWSRVLAMMPAATAGQVLTLTPVGGFALSLAIFGGAPSIGILCSILLIVAGIFVTLRR
jgi:drug/metabolite transporter (DMT)-like permease